MDRKVGEATKLRAAAKQEYKDLRKLRARRTRLLGRLNGIDEKRFQQMNMLYEDIQVRRQAKTEQAKAKPGPRRKQKDPVATFAEGVGTSSGSAGSAGKSNLHGHLTTEANELLEKTEVVPMEEYDENDAPSSDDADEAQK